MLGMIEVDYFGLQFYGPHAELLWLNLRNPVKQQLSGNPPFRLLFKVKFFVPPHLLLQESTRHQFFLNLISDLREGKIRISDRDLLIKLISLIAQADLLDYDSHSVTALHLAYRKWLPMPNDTLRNESMESRFRSLRKSRRRKHLSGPSSASDQDTEEEDSAAILSSSAPSYPPPVLHNAASDHSDHEMESAASDQETAAVCEGVMQLHKQLKGIKSCTAKYLLLKEISDLQDYGVEYFSVRRNTSDELLRLGVGPKGVIVTCSNPISCSIDSPDMMDEHKNR